EAEAEVERGGDVTGGLLDVVAVLSNFAYFRTVVGRSVGVAVEFGNAGREDRSAHVTVVVQAVDAVDVEGITDDTTDEVVDRDRAGEAEGVRLEGHDAVLQRSDGGVL